MSERTRTYLRSCNDMCRLPHNCRLKVITTPDEAIGAQHIFCNDRIHRLGLGRPDRMDTLNGTLHTDHDDAVAPDWRAADLPMRVLTQISECVVCYPGPAIAISLEDKDPAVVWGERLTGMIFRWMKIIADAPTRWKLVALDPQRVMIWYRLLIITAIPLPLRRCQGYVHLENFPYAYKTVKRKCFGGVSTSIICETCGAECCELHPVDKKTCCKEGRSC